MIVQDTQTSLLCQWLPVQISLKFQHILLLAVNLPISATPHQNDLHKNERGLAWNGMSRLLIALKSQQVYSRRIPGTLTIRLEEHPLVRNEIFQQAQDIAMVIDDRLSSCTANQWVLPKA